MDWPVDPGLSDKFGWVLDHLHELRRAYQPDHGLSHPQLRRLVLGFCGECHDMRDWLSPPALPPKNTRTSLETHWYNDADLPICSAATNRYKHLDKPLKNGKTSGWAQVVWTSTEPTGCVATIDYRPDKGTQRTADALQLAEAAVRVQ